MGSVHLEHCEEISSKHGNGHAAAQCHPDGDPMANHAHAGDHSTTTTNHLSVPSDDAEAENKPAKQKRRQRSSRIMDDSLGTVSWMRIGTTLRSIIIVGFPEMLCCLVEPVISCAETVYLGRLSSTYLGATAATTAFFALVSELCCQLSVMAAAAVARDTARTRRVAFEAKRTMDATVAMAVVFGIITTVAVLVANHFGAWTMQGLDPNVANGVGQYVVVRALGITAFMISNACEGAFLGLRDAVTPLRLWTVNGIVSLAMLGSLWFVGGPASMNLANVAFATTSGQVVGAACFLWGLHSRSLIGFQMPQWTYGKKVLSHVSVLLAGAIARMTTYNGMTAAAVTFGIESAAAHKIAFEAYWFLSFLTEPSFTAGNVLMANVVSVSVKKARQMCLVLVGFAALIGVFLLFGTNVWMSTTLFTSDQAVLSVLALIAPWLACKVFFSSIVYSIEGVIIGLGRERYLASIHVMNCGIMLAWGAFATKYAVGVSALWSVMAGYQVLRLVEHSIYFATQKVLVKEHARMNEKVV
ncbi:detoxification protein [Pycnococcus provasolii]